MKYEIYSKGTIVGRNPGQAGYCGYIIGVNSSYNNEKVIGKIIGRIGTKNDKISYKKAELIALNKTIQYFINIIKHVDSENDIIIYCSEKAIINTLEKQWYKYWLVNNWIRKNKMQVINEKEWKELFENLKMLVTYSKTIKFLPFKYNSEIDYLDVAKINAKKYIITSNGGEFIE